MAWKQNEPLREKILIARDAWEEFVWNWYKKNNILYNKNQPKELPQLKDIPENESPNFGEFEPQMRSTRPCIL